MTVLDRRVQVLFDPERFADLQAEAQACHLSVGALIREAVDDRLDRRRRDALRSLEEVWASADEHPSGPIDWAEEKELMEREILRDIP